MNDYRKWSKEELIRELEKFRSEVNRQGPVESPGHGIPLQKNIEGSKLAYKQSKESEARYRDIVENAHAGIIIIDDNYRLVYTNPAFTKIVGYTREELVDMDFRNLLGAKNLEKVSDYYRRRQRGEEVPSIYQLELKRKDGQHRIGEMHVSVMKTRTGNLQSNVQVLDITDFITSKNELVEKTFRLEKAQQIGRVGFLDWDLETNQIILSDLVYEMYGLPAKNFTTPEFVSSVVYPSDLKMVSENLELVIQNKKPYNIEHRVRRPDDTIIWVHARAELSVDEETGKCRLLGTIRDITIQKEVHQKIKKYSKKLETKVKERTRALKIINRKLEDSNRELDTFAYSVSHDLKAPLRAINGFARELQNLVWDRLNEEEKEYLDIVLESSLKMGHLVDDLLKLSRSGRKKPTMRKMAVRPLVKDVLKDVQKNYGGRKVNVSLGRLYTVQADASLLLEVFYNLLDNAFKYTTTREYAEISIDSSIKGDEVVLSITDNGVEFDMKYKDKLFLVFQRLHSDPVFAGTGIGLALVKQIVSRHGGRVWAEGEVDKGARFFITLPRNK